MIKQLFISLFILIIPITVFSQNAHRYTLGLLYAYDSPVRKSLEIENEYSFLMNQEFKFGVHLGYASIKNQQSDIMIVKNHDSYYLLHGSFYIIPIYTNKHILSIGLGGGSDYRMCEQIHMQEHIRDDLYTIQISNFSKFEFSYHFGIDYSYRLSNNFCIGTKAKLLMSITDQNKTNSIRSLDRLNLASAGITFGYFFNN